MEKAENNWIISYEVKQGNIHINNSFNIDSPTDMENILTHIKTNSDSDVVKNRSVRSLKNEWLAHNNLYRLGIEVQRTKDVDLEYPIKWYYRIVYWLLSRIKL